MYKNNLGRLDSRMQAYYQPTAVTNKAAYHAWVTERSIQPEFHHLPEKFFGGINNDKVLTAMLWMRAQMQVLHLTVGDFLGLYKRHPQQEENKGKKSKSVFFFFFSPFIYSFPLSFYFVLITIYY